MFEEEAMTMEAMRIGQRLAMRPIGGWASRYIFTRLGGFAFGPRVLGERIARKLPGGY
jgi:hypothetical protein